MADAEEVLRLANCVLEEGGVARWVSSVKQCNSGLFSSLYQALTGERVPGVVPGAFTSEQVRCQAVVDALARQLPQDVSLEHITGADIAKGDLVSIRNLLDIFSILLHPPSEDGEEEDSNLLSSEGARVVDEVLREELAQTGSSDGTTELLQRVPSVILPPAASRMLQQLREDRPSPPPSLSISTCSSSPPSTPPHPHKLPTVPLHQSTPHQGPRSRFLAEPFPPHPLTATTAELKDFGAPSLSISTLSLSHSAPSSPSPPSPYEPRGLSQSKSTDALSSSSSPSREEGSTSRLVPVTREAHSQPSLPPNTLTTTTVTSTSPTSTAQGQQQTPLQRDEEREDEEEGVEEEEEEEEEEKEEEEEDEQDNDEDEAEETLVGSAPHDDILEHLVENYISERRRRRRRRRGLQSRGGGRKLKFAPPVKGKHSPTLQPRQQQRQGYPPANILPLVEEAFPGVDKSPATVRRLWQQQMKQLTALTSSLPPPSTSQSKIQEVQRRQDALRNLITKELSHTRRMQVLDEQRRRHRAVLVSVETSRQATARARRYFTDYELRMRAKLQKRRTREEQVFKSAFEQCLALQRQHVREMRAHAREKQQAVAQQHADHLHSLEKFYQDQLAMMAEEIAREKEDTAIREKAQKQTSLQLQREVRRKMESDVKRLQQDLETWEQDCAHFRELDAEMLLNRFHQGLLRAV